ncbi:hypothetical protein [Cellulomonas sp.]|nr:hypothetical protein [Cellulomonas sp.]MBO9555914.1 hypothetical protein [Cellulomonas sp.]
MHSPKPWVAGDALNALPGSDSDDDESIKADIAGVIADDDYVSDPWQR